MLPKNTKSEVLFRNSFKIVKASDTIFMRVCCSLHVTTKFGVIYFAKYAVCFQKDVCIWLIAKSKYDISTQGLCQEAHLPFWHSKLYLWWFLQRERERERERKRERERRGDIGTESLAEEKCNSCKDL